VRQILIIPTAYIRQLHRAKPLERLLVNVSARHAVYQRFQLIEKVISVACK
jgi:hypothetical protein